MAGSPPTIGPALLAARSYIRDGDLLTVQEVDRLGRNVLEGLKHYLETGRTVGWARWRRRIAEPGWLAQAAEHEVDGAKHATFSSIDDRPNRAVRADAGEALQSEGLVVGGWCT
jgi:hypothetical protein